MTSADAIALIEAAGLGTAGPETWADLGCGEGTFTLALASLLAPGSTVHAVDRDRAALARLPRRHGGAAIVAHAADFTITPWPFGDLDGLLAANALHYVADRPAFLRACAPHLRRRRLIVVEYDTEQATPWVPYPLGRAALRALAAAAGYTTLVELGTRRSRFGRAPLYATLVE